MLNMKGFVLGLIHWLAEKFYSLIDWIMPTQCRILASAYYSTWGCFQNSHDSIICEHNENHC